MSSEKIMEEADALRLSGNALNTVEFAELVRRWVDRGIHWTLETGTIDDGFDFRSRFIANLSGNTERWERLIEIAIQRGAKSERDYILQLFKNEANRNVLKLLNDVGLSPFHILFELGKL